MVGWQYENIRIVCSASFSMKAGNRNSGGSIFAEGFADDDTTLSAVFLANTMHCFALAGISHQIDDCDQFGDINTVYTSDRFTQHGVVVQEPQILFRIVSA